MKGLIAANAFALLPTLGWVALFSMMAAHYATLPAYGMSGAWDLAVYIPLGMWVGLIASMAVFTFVTRRPLMLALIAGFALLMILPYAALTGGGV